MVKYGYITQEQADEARQADLGLVAKQEQTHEKSNASYFINYVIAQVSEKYGDDAIYKDGLKIYTTLDMDAQNAAVAAMQNLPNYYTDSNGLHQPQGAIVAMNPHTVTLWLWLVDAVMMHLTVLHKQNVNQVPL